MRKKEERNRVKFLFAKYIWIEKTRYGINEERKVREIERKKKRQRESARARPADSGIRMVKERNL